MGQYRIAWPIFVPRMQGLQIATMFNTSSLKVWDRHETVET